MKDEHLEGLEPGVYRLWWVNGGSSVGAVGLDREGRYWFHPSNWVSGPCTEWGLVKALTFLDCQGLEHRAREAARQAVHVVNSRGKVEPCCECGEDYPAEELALGQIYCSKCREKPGHQAPKKREDNDVLLPPIFLPEGPTGGRQ